MRIWESAKVNELRDLTALHRLREYACLRARISQFRPIRTGLIWQQLPGMKTLLRPFTICTTALLFHSIAGAAETARATDASEENPSIIIQAAAAPLKHFAGVTCARFAPDGRRVLTASLDNGARLWDSATGKLLSDLSEHDDRVLYAEFSPDGRKFLTASADNTARIWSAETGDWVTGPMQHAGDVLFAQFSPDGRSVVTVSDDKSVRIWNTATAEPVSDLLFHSDGVVAAAFTSDSKTLITVSRDGMIRSWAVVNGKATEEPVNPGFRIGPAELGPHGRACLSLDATGHSRLWNMGEKRLTDLPAATNTVLARFSLDGRHLMTADGSGKARIWDVNGGKEIGFLTDSAAVTAAAFSKDGQWLATGHKNGMLSLRSVRNSTRVSVKGIQHTNAVTWVEFSSDGKAIVTASLDGTVLLWQSTR